MFAKIYLTIAIVTKIFRIFYDIFMVILSQTSVVSLFSRQKLCVVVSVVPFQLVKIGKWFSFLNALFSCGMKTFYGSILVSSLR